MKPKVLASDLVAVAIGDLLPTLVALSRVPV